MSTTKKLKMSLVKFRAITIPIMAVFLVLALAVTLVTDYFTPSLDTFLGKGARSAHNPAGTSGWDTNYYNFTSTSQEDALRLSAIVAEQTGDEGIVLLKNDGLLPLSSDEPVTPLGYRYIDPVMSGSGSGGTNTTADYVFNAEKGIQAAFTNIILNAAENYSFTCVTESAELYYRKRLGGVVNEWRAKPKTQRNRNNAPRQCN